MDRVYTEKRKFNKIGGPDGPTLNPDGPTLNPDGPTLSPSPGWGRD